MTKTAKKENILNSLRKGELACSGNLIDKLIWAETHLLDPVLWATFVNQFRYHTDTRRQWRGEYWGKTMRGACMTYAYTKNQELLGVLETTVKDLITTMEPSGRISSYPVDREFDGWDMWSRKYVLLGFEYFLEISENKALNKKVLKTACKTADYILSKVGNAEGKKNITTTSQRFGGVNSSSILEPMVKLYNLTGKKKYLDFAKEIIDNGGTKDFDIFKAALDGKLYPYQYPVTKAYEMMSCFEGIVEYYRATGEEKYKTMAINFINLVIESDITIIGTAGLEDEFFDNARFKQFDPQHTLHRQETCVTVTWMKLCYQMLMLTGDSKYADQIEIALYNAMMGAVNINGNIASDRQIFPFDSYSPVRNGVRGMIVGGHQDIIRNRFYWGCCVSISTAGTALPAKIAMMSSKYGVAVNLFIAGEYKTEINGKQVTLKVETDYPKNGNVKITVLSDGTFPIEVRIPEYSKETKLTVAGESVVADSGKFAVINRTWKNGDVIELELDMRTKIITAGSINPEATPEALANIALRRGPITLARDAQLEENIMAVADVVDNEGYAELEEGEAPIECQQFYKVKCKDGSTFPVIDYASAGQTWAKDKPITAWFSV